MNKGAIAVLILLTTSAAAQAPAGEAGKVVLSCTGTGTDLEGSRKPWLVPAAGITIDFTAGTVQGGAFMEEITGVNDTQVDFGRYHDVRGFTGERTMGSIDRVTGEAVLDVFSFLEGKSTGHSRAKLHCRPGQRSCR